MTTTDWEAVTEQLRLNEAKMREHTNFEPMDQDCMRYAGTVSALAAAEERLDIATNRARCEAYTVTAAKRPPESSAGTGVGNEAGPTAESRAGNGVGNDHEKPKVPSL